MRKHPIILFCAVTLMLAGIAAAQRRRPSKNPRSRVNTKSSPSPSPSPQTPQEVRTGSNPQQVGNAGKTDSLLEISIHTSRTQVTAGSGFGIAADIHNKSTQSIYLRPKYLIMSLPSEIDPDPPSMWWALIPPQQSESSDFEQVIHLAPGTTTTVFWAGNPQNEKRKWLKTVWDLMAFPPGEYTIRGVGEYWTDWDSADKQAKNYLTETAESRVTIAAPQWVI